MLPITQKLIALCNLSKEEKLAVCNSVTRRIIQNYVILMGIMKKDLNKWRSTSLSPCW